MRVLKVLGWAWFGFAVAVLLLRWLDLGGPAPRIQAVLPLVGLSVLVLVALAAVCRAWTVAFTAALLFVPYGILAVPWWWGSSGEHQDNDVVVMTVNLLYGDADLNAVEEAVRRHEVDVLVLTEATPEVEEALDRGVLSQLPHRSGTFREDAGGTVVLTSIPHTEIDVEVNTPFDQVGVELESDGVTWRVLGVHTAPPLTWDTSQWRADLNEIEGWIADQPAGAALVVAGDLNSSQAHPAFRAATDGLDSAHQRVGAGWVRTWPQTGWIPRFIQLDHVLVRGLTTVDAGAWDVPGSDHSAVWGRFRIPAVSGSGD